MLILASQSPIRKSLLAGAGLAFETRAANVNERLIEAREAGDGALPSTIAQRLAEAKACAVDEGIAIGADQVLELDGVILHKPVDLDDARDHLNRLRGRTHQLHCGVALAAEGRVLWSEVVTSNLTMRAFSDAERDALLAADGASALQSVGAYRFEGPAIRLFERVDGDYFSILGLPLLPLLAALRRLAPQTLERFT